MPLGKPQQRELEKCGLNSCQDKPTSLRNAGQALGPRSFSMTQLIFAALMSSLPCMKDSMG
jgi:hypothetical protein